MLDTLLRYSDDIKKKVPPKRHFNLTGSLNAGVITVEGVPGLIEKFFDRAVLKEPGEKLCDVIVGFHLLGGFVDVKGADRIQFAPVIRTETQVTFVHDPLCASGGLCICPSFYPSSCPKCPSLSAACGCRTDSFIKLNVL